MEEEESGNKWIKITFILAGLIITGLIIWVVGGMLSAPVEPPKKTVQEIKVIRPPPPPPEVEPEPPPEPEIEEEVDIPEPEPEALPDVPDMEPPPGDLGLDAEGVAGGDAFGLAARKGGRSLIGSGDGDANLWYAGTIVKASVLDALTGIEGILITRYRVRLNLWVDSGGNLTRFKLLESTGDTEVDQKIKAAMANIKRFPELPPPNMPQPVKLVIEAR